MVTKTRLPQTTGDDQARPGIAVFHATLSVVLQVSGRRGSSGAWLIASAPRNAGQLSAAPAALAAIGDRGDEKEHRETGLPDHAHLT